MIDWRQKIADIISARCTHADPEFIEFSTVPMMMEGKSISIKSLQGCHWCHQTYIRVLAAVDESLDDLIASVPDDTGMLLATSLEEFKRSIPSG